MCVAGLIGIVRPGSPYRGGTVGSEDQAIGRSCRVLRAEIHRRSGVGLSRPIQSHRRTAR